jgi:hypothetical protein
MPKNRSLPGRMNPAALRWMVRTSTEPIEEPERLDGPGSTARKSIRTSCQSLGNRAESPSMHRISTGPI